MSKPTPLSQQPHRNLIMSTANSISDSPPPSPASHSGGPDMNPLASVLSLLALIAIPTLIYAFFFTINCPPNLFRRNSSRNAGNLRNKSGKQMDLVSSTVKYMKQEHGGDCPVCLSAFVDGEEVRQLSVCNHSFHVACIDMWLSSHSSCPVCRATVAAKRLKRLPVDGEDDLRQDILHIFSYLPRDLNFLEHTSNIGWKEFQRARPIIVDPGLYHSTKSGVFYAKEKRSMPASFKLFMGSAWVVLTRSFLEFCILGWDNLPRTLLMYYTNFLSSPEGYFHTVVCNHKDYQNTTVNHDLHYIRWDNPPKQHPMTLKLEHYDDMVQSGAPFARKFAKDDPVLNKIDEQLLRRSNGRFSLGGWCAGNSVLDKDACIVYGGSDAAKPSASSKRLEKLVVKLLSSESFRSKQCE